MLRRLHCLAGTSLLVLAMPLMAADAPAERVSPALTAPIAQVLDDVQRVPGAFPAVSAVIVQGGAVPWIHVRGQARAPDGPPADPDTRFYLASQTKSFLGLLGAVLDRKRVLPLDTTLADIWPSLKLPAPADPRRITMADLLSHQEGLTTDTLNFLTAYVRDVPAADYPRLLASETVSRKPGFRYANLGDLVYGAALEARTGRDWHDWLDAEVLRALDLDEVASRTSVVPPARLAWNHQWDGSRWRPFAPKSDALMHAAGGLLASPRAMGRWMQANLGLAGARGALTDADFARAQQPIAHAHLADGEIECDGYSLGWYSCRYRGQRVLMHPGSYVGTVSVTVFVPSAKAGLSLMVNSDSAMEGFELEVMKAFIGLATGQAGESERLRKAVAAYPGRLAKLTRKRQDAIAAARTDAAWGGWAWKPDAAQMKACTGRFDNEVYGTLDVQMAKGRSWARIGAMRLTLDPARPGLFAASTGTMDPPEPFECDADGKRIRWHGREFHVESPDGGS